MKKNTLGILFFLLLELTTFAQNNNFKAGYWITATGERVEGFVAPKILTDGTIKAKVNSPTATIQRLQPQEIQQIVVENKPLFYAESMNLSGGSQYFFVNALLYGEVSLYEGEVGDYGTVYFIERKTGERLLINKMAPERFLTTLFPDCKEALEERSVRYATKSLLETVEAINHCIAPTTGFIVAHDQLDAEFTPYFGGKIFYNLATLTLNEPILDNNPLDFNTLGGTLLLSLWLPKGTILQTGIGYTEKNATREVNVYGLSLSLFEADLTYVEIPFVAGYRFPKWKVKPYVLAGVNVAVRLSGTVEGRDRYDLYDGDYGLLGEIGSFLEINDNSRAFASLSYMISETDYGSNGKDYDLITERWMIGLGYLRSF